MSLKVSPSDSLFHSRSFLRVSMPNSCPSLSILSILIFWSSERRFRNLTVNSCTMVPSFFTFAVWAISCMLKPHMTQSSVLLSAPVAIHAASNHCCRVAQFAHPMLPISALAQRERWPFCFTSPYVMSKPLRIPLAP